MVRELAANVLSIRVAVWGHSPRPQCTLQYTRHHTRIWGLAKTHDRPKDIWSRAVRLAWTLHHSPQILSDLHDLPILFPKFSKLSYWSDRVDIIQFKRKDRVCDFRYGTSEFQLLQFFLSFSDAPVWDVLLEPTRTKRMIPGMSSAPITDGTSNCPQRKSNQLLDKWTREPFSFRPD